MEHMEGHLEIVITQSHFIIDLGRFIGKESLKKLWSKVILVKTQKIQIGFIKRWDLKK
jgi:hypothetical protein